MDIKRIVGYNIRRLRKTRGWSQDALAQRLGVSSQQIHRIETGETGTPLSKIHEIAELFGVSYADLFALPEDDSKAAPIPAADLDKLPHDVGELITRRDRELTIHLKPEWDESGIPPADFAKIIAAVYLALHRSGLDQARPDTKA